MLSIRNISRCAVRSASRFTAQPVARRTLATLYRPSTVQQSSRVASLLSTRAAFSTTPKTQQTQDGQVDGELSAKLQEEFNMEEEMSASEEMPAHLQDFLDSSGFQLSETAGTQEVVLTKQNGKETIKVTFSIADLDAYDPETDPYSEDPALADEGVDGLGASGNKGASGATDEAAAAQEDAGEEEPSFPARLDVTIEKAGTASVVQFTTTATDGQILIENVFHYPNKALADAKDAQTEWSQRELYTGPPYGNLDEDLQVLMEKYLDERGINTALALWVPEFIDFKEQREYVQWLQNLKNFVDA